MHTIQRGLRLFFSGVELRLFFAEPNYMFSKLSRNIPAQQTRH